MKDGVVLFYCKDETLYPIGLTEEQHELLQITARLFAPLKVAFERPQGKVVNLTASRGER